MEKREPLACLEHRGRRARKVTRVRRVREVWMGFVYPDLQGLPGLQDPSSACRS